MKNTVKKFLIPLTALSLLATGGVFATEAPAEHDVMLISTDAVAPVINGATVDGVSVVTAEENILIPLRLVAEGLGYTVTWHEEDQSITLTKGAQYIRMEIGQDAYSFGRRAPQSLGSAPVLVDDCVTHVPATFITELLNGYYSANEDGTYKVVIPSIVTVTAVNEDGSLTVSDSSLGEVVVYLDQNTVITDSKGNAVTADSIKSEMVLGIEYSPAMTASLPPQTTAIAIRLENSVEDAEEIENETPAEAATFSGVITEIDGERVFVGERQDANAVCLIVTEDTEIKHAKNKRIYRLNDLEVGMEISGTLSEAMTMSIPPQSVALTIEISK